MNKFYNIILYTHKIIHFFCHNIISKNDRFLLYWIYSTPFFILSFILFDIAPCMSHPLTTIEVDARQQKTIAFLPQTIPIYHYKDVLLKGNFDVLEIRRALVQAAESHPYLHVLSIQDIEKAFTTAKNENLDAGVQAEADMGFANNFMATMNYESAIVMLQRIIANYEKSLFAFFKPHDVAKAYQLLAYAYIQQHQDNDDSDDEAAVADPLHPARLAFVELIRYAPYLTMLEGRQSPLRVVLYDQALDLFLENRAYRQTSKEIAVALAHKIGADYLVFLRIVQDRHAKLYLELDLFRADTQSFEYQSIELSPKANVKTQTQQFLDEATLILNSFYACMPIEPLIMPFKAFSVNAGPLFLSYIQHPTSNITTGVGVQINFNYRFHRLFFVRASMLFASILRDNERTLNDNFETYHFPVLIGFNYAWKYFKPYIGLGVDFSFSSPYTIIRSQTCKIFGIHDRECLKGDVSQYRDIFALNLTVASGFSFIFDPIPMDLSLEVFFNVTAYPTSDRLFKYPFGASLTFGYLF